MQVFLTNLISFYDKETHLVDERNAVDVIYLDLAKPLTLFPTEILLEKLAGHAWMFALSIVKNWVDGWALRVMLNGMVN